MQPLSPRFTLSCLKELNIPIPSLEDQVVYFRPSHSLLDEAERIHESSGEDYFKRIQSIDDNRFLKCKPNDRFRGAIWVDDPAWECVWWIVSGGFRTEGSRSDFYAELEAKCKAHLKMIRKGDSSFKKGKSSSSDWLLPVQGDYAHLASARSYANLLIKKNEIEQVYERSIKNHNLPYAYSFDKTLVEFNSLNETEINITFSANDYITLMAHSSFITSVLGFDSDSYEVFIEQDNYYRYVRRFYCLK